MAVSLKRDIFNNIIKFQKIGIFVFALLGLEANYGPSIAVELNFYLKNSSRPIPRNPNFIRNNDYKSPQNINLGSFQIQAPVQIIDLKVEGTPSLKQPKFGKIKVPVWRAKSTIYPVSLPINKKQDFLKSISFNEPKPVIATSDPETNIKTWEKFAVPVQPDGRPMIAIVFDDLGIDKSRTQRVIELPSPLTLSFLPYANNLGVQLKAARKAGHEIWMHVPMEPSTPTIDPGPQVLLTGSSPREINESLAWNLDRFDGYVGINNHMGSRFTAHLAEMHVVMEELHRRGLAFLDSLTSEQSQAGLAATTAEVDFATRNIFIDHKDSLDMIRLQLEKTKSLARKKGHAIAIAHPRDNTLKVISSWLNHVDQTNFLFVPVSALLKRSEENLGK